MRKYLQVKDLEILSVNSCFCEYNLPSCWSWSDVDHPLKDDCAYEIYLGEIKICFLVKHKYSGKWSWTNWYNTYSSKENALRALIKALNYREKK